MLLEMGADALHADKEKRTLLMWAASTGNHDIMTALIQKDVPIKAKDVLGRTALQYACNERVSEPSLPS